MLKNRNVYNKHPGENIITMLSKLSYMSDIRHLKRKDVKAMIKHLRLRMGWRPPVDFGTTNTMEQKPAPPDNGSVALLASSSSNSFWIMGL